MATTNSYQAELFIFLTDNGVLFTDLDYGPWTMVGSGKVVVSSIIFLLLVWIPLPPQKVYVVALLRKTNKVD